MFSPTSSLKREEYLKKKRNQKLLRYGLFVLFVLLVISAMAYIAHRPQLRLTNIQLNGEILVSPQEVASASRTFMSGSYLWLLPKNNFLLYRKGALTQHLADTFKRIDTIHVSRKGFTTLVVDITERKPVATWCDGDPVSTLSIPQCYFMDENSTIFASAPQFSGDAYFKYYGLLGTSTPIGSFYIASSTEFRDMTAFVKNLKDLSLKPLYIVGKGGGDFSVTLSSGGQIYFDTKEPLRETFSNLEALLRTPALAQNISDLDYIDLRFGNKLYYKLR